MRMVKLKWTTPLIKYSDEMATTQETSLLQSTNNLIREGEEELYY